MLWVHHDLPVIIEGRSEAPEGSEGRGRRACDPVDDRRWQWYSRCPREEDSMARGCGQKAVRLNVLPKEDDY